MFGFETSWQWDCFFITVGASLNGCPCLMYAKEGSIWADPKISNDIVSNCHRGLKYLSIAWIDPLVAAHNLSPAITHIQSCLWLWRPSSQQMATSNDITNNLLWLYSRLWHTLLQLWSPFTIRQLHHRMTLLVVAIVRTIAIYICGSIIRLHLWLWM